MRSTLPFAILLALFTTAAAAAVTATDAAAQTRPTLRAFGSDAELHEFVQRIAVRPARKPTATACADSPEVAVVRHTGVAQSTGAVITGRIRSGSGPVAGAAVSVQTAGAGTSSGADGELTLVVPASALVGADTLTLSVSALGHSPASLAVALQPGDSVVVDVKLCEVAIALESLAVAGAALSITNVQHAGVDEGGIVKLHGDHLVVLRRGRLFTIDLRGGRLDPVAAVDAFAPGADASNDWYDELLIAGDIVIVIGYSYGRGGTEVNLFRIDGRGGLHYRSTYHLRSNDYYSSRNYSSRLVDGKLVFYAPLSIHRHAAGDVTELLPAMRRWRPYGAAEAFRPIATATRVYRPARDLPPERVNAVHTVTTCDVARGELDCEATALFGAFAHTFYVSPASVWLWLAGGGETAMLYRMPLDGGAPTALGVTGMPIDQFSFLEDASHLNVFVSARGHGQWMWRAEAGTSGLALLRVPLASLGAGDDDAPASRYLPLPDATGYALQNRFVGDHLLYGGGSGWARPASQPAPVVNVVHVSRGTISRVPLRHGVDRIERLGSGALLVGADEEDLHFTSIRLDARPAAADHHVLHGASQGEVRSHGFFFRADGPTHGILGLPVSRPGRAGYRHLFEDAAAIVFLAADDLRFSRRGELAARPGTARDDGCRASCVDWYGNARPLFIRGRILALLGYELVEGRLRPNGIRELRRTYFGPRAHVAGGGGS